MEFKRPPRQPHPQPHPRAAAPTGVPNTPVQSSALLTRLTTIYTYVSHYRLVIAGGFVAVVAIGLLTSTLLHRQTTNAPNQRPTDQATVSKDLNRKTITPSGNPVDAKGGWNRIRPPGKKPVFAYPDSINGVGISVSQQALPDSFKADVTESVAGLAKSYNATTTAQAAESTVYIGDSAKGPQSVIFTKNNLLIMIKSQQKIPTDAWVQYITSLQ